MVYALSCWLCQRQMQFNVSSGKVSTKGQKRGNAIQRVKVNYETQFIQLTIDNSAHKGRICRREEKEVGVWEKYQLKPLFMKMSVLVKLSFGEKVAPDSFLMSCNQDFFFFSDLFSSSFAFFIFYLFLIRLVRGVLRCEPVPAPWRAST